MSETLGSISFLSWMRRGLSAYTTAAEGGAGLAPRLILNAGAIEAAGPTLVLAGPEHVSGFDGRAVTRVWPAPGTLNADPNLFPVIEFDQPDFPWRYSHEAGSDRLTPWLALVAVDESEVSGYQSASNAVAFSSIVVANTNTLPAAEQAFAWAHVQVSGATTVTEADLAIIASDEPNRILSRILCPRRLKPRTRYRAMLTPVFQRGRLRALGEPSDRIAEAGPTDWAWRPNETACRIPIYFEWEFQTGDVADFRTLLQRLEPRQLPSSVGRRYLNAVSPGSGMPSAGTRLRLDSALRAPSAAPPEPEIRLEEFDAAFRSLLNRGNAIAEGGEAIESLAPPLYGRWHAQRHALPTEGEPGWFEDLNTTIAHRVAAGAGTKVVQNLRQELLSGAWRQVPQAREVNEFLRTSQLAREQANRLLADCIQLLGLDELLFVTAPVHAKVKFEAESVRGMLRNTPIVPGTLQAQFRRIRRPGGTLWRRAAGGPAANLFERMNAGEVQAAREPVQPKMLSRRSTLASFLAALHPDAALPDGRQINPKLPLVLPPHATFKIRPWRRIRQERPAKRGDEDSPEATLFRTEAHGVLKALVHRTTPPSLRPVDLTRIRSTIEASLSPDRSIHPAVNSRLRLATSVRRSSDPCEQLAFAPEFDVPMYRPLKELSIDWLLSGLGDIPPDSICLLESNNAFIEAYMAGLNQEMARELMWRGFPCDRTRTYFHAFWDAAPLMPSVENWHLERRLGTNLPSSDSEQLVLLIRGELLQRYPRARVYARRAHIDGPRRMPRGERRNPIFAGGIEPDIRFFGFQLSIPECIGSASDPGWFFVIEEHSAEAAFGLRAPGEGSAPPLTRWAELSWHHLFPPGATDLPSSHIDLSSDLPNVTAIADRGGREWRLDDGAMAAHVAAISLRKPARAFVHAAEMLRRAGLSEPR